ncbi:MAG TPA: DUF359 domain-containing protein [Methanocorpusculum sp.]|nr:DUF359 domain-containing protein [Methanocorpusculum sp.]
MLTLPARHRALLKEPFGKLFPDFSDIVPVLRTHSFCTVGDVVTANAFRAGLTPEIAIIDGITKRSPYLSMPEVSGHIIHVQNPAGALSAELLRAIEEASHARPAVVMVEGEEDLAVIPLVNSLKDGEIILYGQPDEGVVLCTVGPALRSRAAEIFACFWES